ncbi:hypothetical protein HPC62_04235 [Thermoleptolyngbya sichuanensis A183]|uniref:Uncharacterized protein n=1 Tax=Thermoleptolyngbya sichuanensis A183 TaxID=2737172 RepID=A0A6M8BBQ4_9CYAN|nr:MULTISPECIES: hypothetical protein [Thermoleptolyngbya]MDG2614845.1 hypothetical protein [Thermoleptolyngbya sichuanensis XZ-Cy5]QKD81496.1 hypothetical protein HPC62_04235 [Thermoleptolyngbya sichuanensis A183]
MTAALLHKFTNGVTSRFINRGWGDRPQPSATRAGSSSRQMAASLLLSLSVGLVSSCSQPAVSERRTWKIYQNPNYGFEFPYPDNWMPAPLPDSQDGRRFRNPYSPDVEILGWASHISSTPGDSSEQVRRSVLAAPNFTTRQGLRGQLRVEIGSTVSLMTLTLTEEGVVYFWQGRSPSDQFSQYYEFFDYVAKQYYVTPKGKSSPQPPTQK